ncbi:MAG: stage II sporulation protein P [Bacillota bacterium]
MPGKAINWTSRRRNRYISWKKLLFYLLLLTALAVTGRSLPAGLSGGQSPAVPISATAGFPGGLSDHGTAETPEASTLSRFFQKLIADNIPGMKPPVVTDREEIQGVVLDAFTSLTGVDPRDPRSILSAELGVAALVPLPELHQPGWNPSNDADAGSDPAGDPEQPSNNQPVFSPVFPLPGYGEPTALIYHTHITESFNDPHFSENLAITVARLGVDLVDLLQEKYGLPVLHDTGLYDLPRQYAYEKARPAVEGILADNPQLQMVIDIHRDGMPRELTTTRLDGREVGKILIVIGTRNPGWNHNFRFALRLQQELEAVAPGLSRGIRQQDFIYNQDLHPCAVLIEVGGHQNTLAEAALAVPYLAEALARTYYVFFVQN